MQSKNRKLATWTGVWMIAVSAGIGVGSASADEITPDSDFLRKNFGWISSYRAESNSALANTSSEELARMVASDDNPQFRNNPALNELVKRTDRISADALIDAADRKELNPWPQRGYVVSLLVERYRKTGEKELLAKAIESATREDLWPSAGNLAKAAIARGLKGDHSATAFRALTLLGQKTNYPVDHLMFAETYKLEADDAHAYISGVTKEHPIFNRVANGFRGLGRSAKAVVPMVGAAAILTYLMSDSSSANAASPTKAAEDIRKKVGFSEISAAEEASASESTANALR